MTDADVSVIVPFYNSHATIAQTLRSVARQTLPVREVIVVDDGSENEQSCKDAVQAFQGVMKVRLIRLERNAGAAAARNVGVQNAQGKYVAFLDSDDVWLPEKVAIQFSYMENSGTAISAHLYSQQHTRNANLRYPGRIKNIPLWRFALGNAVFTPTVMALRHNLIPFDENLTRSEDYKCWIENICDGKRLSLIPLVMAHGFKSAIGQSGLSASISRMHTDYLFAIKRLSASPKVPKNFCIAAQLIEQFKYPLRLIKLGIAGFPRRQPTRL